MTLLLFCLINPFPTWSLDDSIVYLKHSHHVSERSRFVPGGIALALGMELGQILEQYSRLLFNNFVFSTTPGESEAAAAGSFYLTSQLLHAFQ